MGCAWGGTSTRSQRPWPTSAARLPGQFRRWLGTGSTSLSLWGWRRGPELSPLADALDAFASGAQIAGRSSFLPRSDRPALTFRGTVGLAASWPEPPCRPADALTDSKNGAVPSQSQRRSRREEVTR